MMYKKTRMFTEWFGKLLNEYEEYKKEVSLNRCKIVGIEIDKQTGKYQFLVKINSIKSQISVSYYPEELVTNDLLLREFSQIDVRAITFYAFNHYHKVDNLKSQNRYKIVGQEFLNDKTLFIFKEVNVDWEQRIFADELYADTDLLKQFHFDDLMNIISTAIQEQTMEDVG